jgi:hypothetical protein
MSGIRTPSRTPRSRQLREDHPSGSRRATPTRATSSVTKEAPSRIVSSSPRPVKSKRSKTAGPKDSGQQREQGSERKQLAHGVGSIGGRLRMRNTSYAIGSVANSLFAQRRGKGSSPKSISSMLHRKFHAGVRIDAWPRSLAQRVSLVGALVVGHIILGEDPTPTLGCPAVVDRRTAGFYCIAEVQTSNVRAGVKFSWHIIPCGRSMPWGLPLPTLDLGRAFSPKCTDCELYGVRYPPPLSPSSTKKMRLLLVIAGCEPALLLPPY